MNSRRKMSHAKRKQSHAEEERKTSRQKRSRLSPTPSSLASIDKDDFIGKEAKEEDLTMILKIGSATKRTYEDKFGPRFRDFGGIEEIIRNLTDNVVTPLRRRLMPVTFGIGPLSGLLLHGPSGCGKTDLAEAIGNETGLPFYTISAADVIYGESGVTMKRIIEEAHFSAPSILFIDDLEAIGSEEDPLSKRRSKRIMKQMIECMDKSLLALHAMNTYPEEDRSEEESGYVLVIGATERIDSLDPELRRPGYFDREIRLGIPDEKERREILSVITKTWMVDKEVDLSKIASTTRGFVGVDLGELVYEARRHSMMRLAHQIEMEFPGRQQRTLSEMLRELPPERSRSHRISTIDFEEAAKIVQPST